VVHSSVAAPDRASARGQLTLVPTSDPDRRAETDRPPDRPPGPPGDPDGLPTDTQANPPPTREPSPPPAPSPGARRPRPRRGHDKVIFRIDWTAASRGHTLGPDHPDGSGLEETCDIVGIGPVPVSVVRHVLEEHPILAIVLTHGTDIRAVTHLGRTATAAMRTCLEWAQQGCSVLGCPNTGRLELDHDADWALTLHTRLDQLDWLCTKHHQQKTHDGYRLEPGTGTRRFLPPPDP
jgi:hypothetical protein